VNHVFAQSRLHQHLSHFHPHDTHEKALWGKVTILPLPDNEEGKKKTTREETQDSFRHPLQEPRVNDETRHYRLEAEQIAATIQSLIEKKTLLKTDGQIRPVSFSDILILFRTRTHVQTYEEVFTQRGIPFIGTDKGTFLDCLEIQDLCTLLELIISPHDNLRLAQILKSPLFGLDDNALEQLAATQSSSWYEYLAANKENPGLNPDLLAAFSRLESWRTWVNRVPVHDFLDKIYSETSIVERYLHAFPAPLHPRLLVNFSKFIDLALEFESGRYPSVSKFLSNLRSLGKSPMDAPDTPAFGQNLDRIRMMTVHASKGLEAPVVILADTNSVPSHNDSHHVLTRWPATSTNPEYLVAVPNACKQNHMVNEHFQHQQNEETIQSVNLLYVALTRAKQYLYISGAQGKSRSADRWYALLKEQLQDHCQEIDGRLESSYGKTPSTSQAGEITNEATQKELSQREQDRIQQLSETVKTEIPADAFIDIDEPLALAPSEQATGESTVSASGNEDASARGELIHRLFELRLDNPEHNAEQIFALIDRDNRYDATEEDFDVYWGITEDVLNNPGLQHLFDPEQFEQAHNEIPINYNQANYTVSGVIDRLVITQDSAWIIDYKTHQNVRADNVQEHQKQFEKQLALYADGVKKLWPDKNVRPCLLFTEINTLVELSV
jgi:ATP-dependent helicase/nuclease subunit A